MLFVVVVIIVGLPYHSLSGLRDSFELFTPSQAIMKRRFCEVRRAQQKKSTALPVAAMLWCVLNDCQIRVCRDLSLFSPDELEFVYALRLCRHYDGSHVVALVAMSCSLHRR